MLKHVIQRVRVSRWFLLFIYGVVICVVQCCLLVEPGFMTLHRFIGVSDLINS